MSRHKKYDFEDVSQMSASKDSIVSIGGRIKHFRAVRGLSQKQLGMAIGFDEKAACVRIAQYETGARTPKKEILGRIATTLHIPVQVLDVPQIDSPAQFMQLLFALEDISGGAVNSRNSFPHLSQMLAEWDGKKADLQVGKISRSQYDKWRNELT